MLAIRRCCAFVLFVHVIAQSGCDARQQNLSPATTPPPFVPPAPEAMPGRTQIPLTPASAREMLARAEALAKGNPVHTMALFRFFAANAERGPDQLRPVLNDVLPEPGLPRADQEVAERELGTLQQFIEGRVGPEVINGKPAGSLFPECVAIGRWKDRNTGGWCCSGVLISPTEVLTASHCFDRKCLDNSAPTGDLHDVWVYFGPGGGANGEPVQAKSFRQFSGPFLPNARDDLAIIVIPAQQHVRPVKLASFEQINAAKEVTVVGFGLTEEGKHGEKRYAPVKVAVNSCAQANPYGCHTEREFVASGPIAAGLPASDTCLADSGGPAYVIVSDQERYVAGITSSGVFLNGQAAKCGEGGIYGRMDIPQYRTWLGIR